MDELVGLLCLGEHAQTKAYGSLVCVSVCYQDSGLMHAIQVLKQAHMGIKPYQDLVYGQKVTAITICPPSLDMFFCLYMYVHPLNR